MKLRTSLKIAIIVLSTLFSLPSLAEAQRVAIKQITDTFNGFSGNPSISSDGTKVVFSSNGDFTGSNTDHNHEIFLYDITTGKFTQITNTTGFDPFDPPTNSSPSINADGTKVVFVSEADIIGSNGDRNPEIFLYDITTGKFIQITNSTGFGNFGFLANALPSISADGNKIVFISDADFNGSNRDRNQEIFLYDITAGKFIQITNTTDPLFFPNLSPSISADGTKVAFESGADITGSNRDGNGEIFLATIQEGFPYVLLNTPEANLKAGDFLRLDLILQPGQSSFHIDVFFSIEMGSKTLYLAPDLSFVPNRVAVASNFPLPPDMPDWKARMFGPPPSILGEVIIPPGVSGTFTFKVEITNSQTGESLGSDKVTFVVR